MHVLDVLRERGYTPRDDAPPSESWFDLAITGPAGRATVRAILTPEDGCEIHVFDRYGASESSARFSGAPAAVFLTTLEAAEREAFEAAGIDWPCSVCDVTRDTHPLGGSHGYTPWRADQ